MWTRESKADAHRPGWPNVLATRRAGVVYAGHQCALEERTGSVCFAPKKVSRKRDVKEKRDQDDYYSSGR